MSHSSLIIAVVLAVVIFAVFTFAKNAGVKGISGAQAQDLLKDSSVVILDVRTQKEFKSGHIKGATLIPVQELSGRIGEISAMKDKQVFVYCHSGMRSGMAAGILKKNGFTKVLNLRGGIGAWTASGGSTVQ